MKIIVLEDLCFMERCNWELYFFHGGDRWRGKKQ